MKIMTRKYLFLVVTAFALCGCQGQAVNAEKVEAKAVVNQEPDAQAVVNRVQEIYKAVFKEYNLEDSLRNLDIHMENSVYERRADFEANYCSGEWNALLKKVNEIDSLYHQNEMGFWDFDYWIMAQDWHNLSISDVEVLSITPTEALVQFQLHNFDSSTPVVLHLVLEDGVWKIDDFPDVDNDLGWKKSMQEYVDQETARNKN